METNRTECSETDLSNLEGAKLAHEIKNSLTLMKSSLNVIEKDNPTIKKHPYWSSLHGEIGFICSILDDYAAIHSLNSYECLLIDLGDVIEDTCGKFAPLLIENNITLKLSMPKEILYVYGDEVKLQECFANLIKNAIEAIEDKGSIQITLSIFGDFIRVCIEDTGAGIEEAYIEDILKPYVTLKEKGTGLGLTIIQNIITQHHGRFDIESIVGKGTTFNLYFPLASL